MLGKEELRNQSIAVIGGGNHRFVDWLKTATAGVSRHHF